MKGIVQYVELLFTSVLLYPTLAYKLYVVLFSVCTFVVFALSIFVCGSSAFMIFILTAPRSIHFWEHYSFLHCVSSLSSQFAYPNLYRMCFNFAVHCCFVRLKALYCGLGEIANVKGILSCGQIGGVGS